MYAQYISMADSDSSNGITLMQSTPRPSFLSEECPDSFNVTAKFECIKDHFETLAEIRQQIKVDGVDVNCGIIFGIDYTLTNNMQGDKTFGGKSLHAISKDGINPYQKVICILGETLEPLDDDGVFPAYGFGDNTVKDKDVFPLKGSGLFNGFGDILKAYNEVTPTLDLGGPTNYAPMIRETIKIVKELKKYHILVIVTDGQIANEQETIDAIVEASYHPISIVVIGVGDGPWEVMTDFDDKLPERQFDNFQFVDFHKVREGARNPQAAVALAALMEIPDQFRLIKERGLLPQPIQRAKTA